MIKFLALVFQILFSGNGILVFWTGWNMYSMSDFFRQEIVEWERTFRMVEILRKVIRNMKRLISIFIYR